MDKQKEYDRFFEESNTGTLDGYCNVDFLDLYEKAILKMETKTKRLMDVGCGSGNRLFDFYNRSGIEYYGVEKSINFINGSKHKDKIFQLDLTNRKYFSQFREIVHNLDFVNYDTIALFGGVINGLIDKNQRGIGWENIEKMLRHDTYLIIHSIGDRRWYYSGNIGKCLKLINNVDFPNQYLYTRKELGNIFEQHKLKIINEYNLDLPAVTLKHSFFVIKKCS